MRQSLFTKASLSRCFFFLPIALTLLMFNGMVSRAATPEGDQLLSFFPEHISLRVKIVGDLIDSTQSPTATYKFDNITCPTVPIYIGSHSVHKKISLIYQRVGSYQLNRHLWTF